MAMDYRTRNPDFYPRPPRGGRRVDLPPSAVQPLISTHALREEGDCRRPTRSSWPSRFLPTPSARRATKAARVFTGIVKFLPTPSARRATFSLICKGDSMEPFLPTPSARRATPRGS